MRAASVLLAAALLALAGCAPSTGGPTATRGAEGPGTGTVRMVLWPGPEGEAMGEVVDAYNSGPGVADGITVEMTLLSRQDTFSKEAALMATRSSQQDIYFVASYNVAQFAHSLDPLTKVDADTYFPVAAEGLQFDGEQFALPLDVSTHFLYYRKDLLDELLDATDTWPQYESVAEQATGERRQPKPAEEWDWTDYVAMSAWFSRSANPASPTEYGTILAAKNILYNTMVWNDVLWGSGGSWTTPEGAAALTAPPARAAVEVYRDIYTGGWATPDSAQAEFPEVQAALKSGNTMMALQWSAGFAELNDPQSSPTVAGRIAIAPVPGQHAHVHALAVALNAYSENKAAARTFLEFLATPDAMQTYARAGGIPAIPAVLEANADINPVFEMVAESIDRYGYSPPTFPGTFEAYSRLAEDLSPAWLGQEEVDSALERANARLQQLLDE